MNKNRTILILFYVLGTVISIMAMGFFGILGILAYAFCNYLLTAMLFILLLLSVAAFVISIKLVKEELWN